MRRLVSAISALRLAGARATVAGRHANRTSTCGAPAEFVTTDASLAQLAAAIAAGGPVDILAVGSATTVGSLTTAGEHSASQGGAFPWHMVRALHAALPSVEFRLTVRGGRGMTAEEMLPLIDAALKQQRYPLVLWQTGTVEAVRGLQPDGMLDVLACRRRTACATRAAIWC